ncbi:MAG: carboxypeptidase-like regulatory domain-containing protein [Burkholderiales bacterium]
MRFTKSCLVMTLALPFAPHAWAGADSDEHDETGPRVFGFIRDNDGKALSNAKVTANIKGFGALVARSNATGSYRVPVPGLGQKVAATGVVISCEKDGYKQLRVVMRTAPNKKPLTALEIDCRMQAIKGK